MCSEWVSMPPGCYCRNDPKGVCCGVMWLSLLSSPRCPMPTADGGTATRRRGKSDDNLWGTARIRKANSSASSIGERRRGFGDDGSTRGSRIRKVASGGVGNEAAMEGQGMGSRRQSWNDGVRSRRTQGT